MTKPRNSMVFIVTDSDRELMEAFRARRGLRSAAEALRTMIRESGEAPLQQFARAMSPVVQKSSAFKPHPKPGKAR